MTTHYDSEQITAQGRDFEVRFYYDEDSGPPWEESDGHGPVREIRSRDDKRPGERIMTSGERHSYIWAYDVQAAMNKARNDGWGLSDEAMVELCKCFRREPTKGEVIARAVEKDFEYLNGWVTDQWHWMGVVVLPLDRNGDAIDDDEFMHACWGIVSNGDYWREVAEDLAGEIIHDDAKAAESAEREANETAYRAARGVETVGV